MHRQFFLKRTQFKLLKHLELNVKRHNNECNSELHLVNGVELFSSTVVAEKRVSFLFQLLLWPSVLLDTKSIPWNVNRNSPEALGLLFFHDLFPCLSWKTEILALVMFQRG